MGYLVISRKIGERIRVGKDIEILIADIADKKADIAVRAPKEVRIEKLGTHMEEQQKQEGAQNGIVRANNKIHNKL